MSRVDGALEPGAIVAECEVGTLNHVVCWWELGRRPSQCSKAGLLQHINFADSF